MGNIFNMFGGFQNFLGQFNNFSQNVQQQGIDPKQTAYNKAQQMLDSGAISQDQYNQILSMAGMIRGMIPGFIK